MKSDSHKSNQSVMLKKGMLPFHPGEILREDYFKGLNSTVTQAAKALKVAHNNLSAIFNERAGIRPEMAVKLSGSLGIYAQFWLNLQGNYDLWQAEQRVNRSRIQHFNPAA